MDEEREGGRIDQGLTDTTDGDKTEVGFDDILHQVGELGRHQLVLSGLIVYAAAVVGMSTMNMVFTLGFDDYRCAIPGLSNDTYFSQGDAHDDLVNATIPKGSKCTVYDVGVNGTGEEKECSRWVYDDTIYRPSAVMDFNLVCDRTAIRSAGNTAYLFGLALGGPVGGVLSDRFGRKIVSIVSLISTGVAGLVLAFAPDIYTFMVIRFIVGGVNAAFYGAQFVMLMEFVGPSKRVYPPMAVWITWALGAMLLTPLAYFFRNWRHLMIATVVPSLLFLPYWWLTPESPRWLISRGRKKEAEKVLRKMAKVNKRPLPENMLTSIQLEGEVAKKESFWKMLKEKVLLARFAITLFTWCATSAGYFGLQLFTNYMVGDIYINFTVGVMMDIPGALYTMFVPIKFGRKAPHIFALFLAGGACGACVVVLLYGNDALLSWLPTTLATIAKFGVTASFASVYLYSTELFPTSMRNQSTGIINMLGGLTTVWAPYLADLGALIPGPFSGVLSLVVFGSLLILAGFLSLLLPDTHGKPLPDSIQQAIHWKKRQKQSNNFEMTSNPIMPMLSTERDRLEHINIEEEDD